MYFGFAIKGRTTINLPDDDQRKLCLWFIVPASNGGRQSTARQTFEPECLIVFWFRDHGPNDNQFAGRRSEEVEFVVHCSGIERGTAINCATDFQAGVHDCVCLRDQGPSDIDLPDDDQSELCFVPSASRTNQWQASDSPTHRRQAVAGYVIER